MKEISSGLILSDHEGGLDEDRILASSFQSRGIGATIVDWKVDEFKNSSFYTAVDFCLIRTPWDYVEHVEFFLSRLEAISSHVPLINSLETVRWNWNKKYLIDLYVKGIPAIETVFVPEKNIEDIDLSIRRLGGDEFILKSAVGSGGYQMARFKREELSNTEIDHVFGFGYGALLQRFRPEIIERGEWALLYFGDELVHSVHKTASKGEYRIQRQFGGLEVAKEPPSAVLDVAKSVKNVVPGNPVIHRIDILDVKDQPLVIEVEVIEPRLYFDVFPEMADRLVDSVISYLAE